MDLKDAYDFLDFCINKSQGVFYTPPEKDLIVDRAQITLYNEYYRQYSASQRLDDALNPFKVSLDYTSNSTGLILTPGNYFNFLSGWTVQNNSLGNPTQRPIEIVKEDELPLRLNSQLIPVTTYDPIGLFVNQWDVQLYPKVQQSGTLFYLRRPAAPVFAYTVISGRVIVYNQGGSTQLEWADQHVRRILILALRDIGINASEKDIMEWSEVQNQQRS